MLLVKIVCSDSECTEERELAVESLDEVEGYPCECGHGFVLISVSELEDPIGSGRVISLPERHHSSARRAA
jgi:hypothetical protein